MCSMNGCESIHFASGNDSILFFERWAGLGTQTGMLTKEETYGDTIKILNNFRAINWDKGISELQNTLIAPEAGDPRHA